MNWLTRYSVQVQHLVFGKIASGSEHDAEASPLSVYQCQCYPVYDQSTVTVKPDRCQSQSHIVFAPPPPPPCPIHHHTKPSSKAARIPAFHTVKPILSMSSTAAAVSSTPEWQLYYWPGLPGRGEFARLLFHETDTPYTEPFAHSTPSHIQSLREQLSTAQPFFALPLLVHTPPLRCLTTRPHLSVGRHVSLPVVAPGRRSTGCPK